MQECTSADGLRNLKATDLDASHPQALDFLSEAKISRYSNMVAAKMFAWEILQANELSNEGEGSGLSCAMPGKWTLKLDAEETAKCGMINILEIVGIPKSAY